MFYRWWQKIAFLFLLGFLLVLLINSAWFLKIFYPYPHQKQILQSSNEYHVDPHLVLAIIRTESRFYSRANSHVGAKGLMQIMPETGTWIAGQMKIKDYNEEMLFDPEYNLRMGIWYLSYLEKNFQGNNVIMLAAYNAGENKVKRWLAEGLWTGMEKDIGQIPYQETRDYIEKVLFDYQVYKRVYKKAGSTNPQK